jgi:hypothetical protein
VEGRLGDDKRRGQEVIGGIKLTSKTIVLLIFKGSAFAILSWTGRFFSILASEITITFEHYYHVRTRNPKIF